MTDVLGDDMLVVRLGMLSDVVIGVAVDMLTEFILGVVTAVDAEMFTDENANGFAVVVTPLEFTLSAP